MKPFRVPLAAACALFLFATGCGPTDDGEPRGALPTTGEPSDEALAEGSGAHVPAPVTAADANAPTELNRALSPWLRPSVRAAKLERSLATLSGSGGSSTRWQAGPWGACSAACDGGMRYRDVACVDETDTPRPGLCAGQNKSPTASFCNTEPCEPGPLPQGAVYVGSASFMEGTTSLVGNTLTVVAMTDDSVDGLREARVELWFAALPSGPLDLVATTGAPADGQVRLRASYVHHRTQSTDVWTPSPGAAKVKVRQRADGALFVHVADTALVADTRPGMFGVAMANIPLPVP